MKRVMAAGLMLLATSAVGWAQTAAEHEKHHQQEAAPATTEPAPPASQQGMGGHQGMMGGGGMMDMTQHSGSGMGGTETSGTQSGQMSPDKCCRAK